MSGIFGPPEFHAHHGSNIQLTSGSTVATRTKSFKDGITFSSRPLAPWEIFLIEITETDLEHWSGDLRIGLTQLSPNYRFQLPHYACPNLQNMGHTWMSTIPIHSSTIHKDIIKEGKAIKDADFELQTVQHEGGHYIVTPRGTVRRRKFVSKSYEESNSTSKVNPQAKVGSRIGVFYVPISRDVAKLYIVINGEDMGSRPFNIPLNNGPLWALIDVYGCTTQVEVVTIEDSLMSMCRDVILDCISLEHVSSLQLPGALKAYIKQT